MEPAADGAEHLELAGAMVPSLRTLAPRAFVAGILPVVVYAILRPHVGSDAVGLAIVMVFPLGDILVERVRHGHIEPIGIIALVGIAIGLAGALLLHGNDLLLKMRDSSLTGVFGLVCLGSLLRPKPAMYYLARAFATSGDPTKVEQFEEIWARPGVAERFKLVTAVWGVGLLLEAAVRVVLALALSTQTFLAVSQVVSWLALGGLIVFTIRRVRAGQAEVGASFAADAEAAAAAALQAIEVL